jgi:hypothetical protein
MPFIDCDKKKPMTPSSTSPSATPYSAAMRGAVSACDCAARA